MIFTAPWLLLALVALPLLWVVLALAVVALVAWYLNNDGVDQVDVAPATSMHAPVHGPVHGPVAAPLLALARAHPGIG